MDTVGQDDFRASGRQRLLILASTFPATTGDGTPGFVADLAARQARVFDTLVLVPRVGAAPVDEERDGYRIRRFAYFPRRWEDLAEGAILENLRGHPTRLFQVPFLLVAEAVAVRRAIREFDPDVLHVHWIIPQGLAALGVARRLPWLVTTLGGDLYALDSRAWRAIKRAVLRRAAAASVMNAEMAARLVALGMPPDRVHIMPMGADVERVRSMAGENPVPGRILFVGRLVEKKGVAVLLTALDHIGSEVPWSLDVVGDGPLRAELEARAGRLPNPVRFHGQQPARALATLLHECEIAVFPSLPARSGDQDGLPVAMLEAMAAGRAVVASRIAGIDEAIVDGTHGVLVPPRDATALATALRSLLTDPDRRAALGERAAVRAESYSVDAVGERYVALLQSILERPGTLSREA